MKLNPDLIIMDADGTIAPHLTVALANEVVRRQFLKTFFGNKIEKTDKLLTTSENIRLIIGYFFNKKIKLSGDYYKLFRLCIRGIYLYLLKYGKDFTYFLGLKANNKVLIRSFVNTIDFIDIDKYVFTEKQIEKSLYHGIKEFLNNKKCPKAIISQSFCYKNGFLENYKKILGVNEIISNEFISNKKLYARINVKSSEDKKIYAKMLIKKYNAKNVCMIINDYVDKDMVGLKEIKTVILQNPPLRMRKFSNIIVKEDYSELL